MTCLNPSVRSVKTLKSSESGLIGTSLSARFEILKFRHNHGLSGAQKLISYSAAID